MTGGLPWAWCTACMYTQAQTGSSHGACACAQSWIKTMAAHLKAADPNHLVGVGEEGFYGAPAGGDRSRGVNPTGT